MVRNFIRKFEDDNTRLDTKIIYASMFVNGEEINLYNFKFNKLEDFYDIKGRSITKSLMKTPLMERDCLLVWYVETSTLGYKNA